MNFCFRQPQETIDTFDNDVAVAANVGVMRSIKSQSVELNDDVSRQGILVPVNPMMGRFRMFENDPIDCSID